MAAERAAARRAPLAPRLLLALLPVLLIAAVVEAVCRVRERGAARWWDAVTDEQIRSQNLAYSLNSDGLRDDPITAPKPKGRRRVLLLGDSFLFGLGVEPRAAIFCDELEAQLNARPPDPAASGYELVNGGIPGSVTGDWIGLCDRVAERVEPDLVVAVFFMRDGSPLTFLKDFFGPVRAQMQRWSTESLLARTSAAWRLWRGQRLALAMTHDYVDAFQRSYFGSDAETAEWRAAQANLKALRDRFAARHVPFALVVFPALFELGPDYPFARICDAIEQFGRAQQMPTFSLVPAFSREEAAPLWVSPHDQHPNARGHKIAADALEPWLRGLLAPKGG